jgi:hypothetical protein
MSYRVWHCTAVEIKRRFRRPYCLHLQCRRESEIIRQMEEAIGKKRSSDFFRNIDEILYQTTRHQIPEDNTLHNHRSKNLRSYFDKIEKSSFVHKLIWMKVIQASNLFVADWATGTGNVFWNTLLAVTCRSLSQSDVVSVRHTSQRELVSRKQ